MTMSDTVFDYDKVLFEASDETAPYPIGVRTSHSIRTDPRHILFSLSRYKFCAKMLEGKQHVLEVGCGDAFCAPIILQTVSALHGIDIEPLVIEQNRRQNQWGSRLTFECLDLASRRPDRLFDAAFCLDVIEHVQPEKESAFLGNLAASLKPDGVCIVGTPNIHADAWATPLSRAGHINLKSHATLKESMSPFFEHIFLFSMNDEVLHTGYSKMAHFIFAL